MTSPGMYCPYGSKCKGSTSLKFKVGDLNRRIGQETFNYNGCSECQLIFIDPTPSNLGEYYPSTYYYIPSSLEELASAAEHERYKVEIVKRFVTRGRLLEIGPSVGGFAYLAKQAGFEVETIEQDTNCCKFLNDVVGVRTINSEDVCAALKKVEPYDAIALWHVIEHLPNPWITLEAAIERLLPGGILVIAAPNPAAFQFSLFKSLWTHLDAPRHVVLIPAELLEQQMQMRGFETVLLTTTDPGSLGWNIFGWQFSLQNLLQNLFANRFPKLSMRLGRLISRVVSPIERSGFLGSTYTAVFQKKR